MAAPSTSVTWVNSGLAVLVRDYAGSATDLSPGGTFGSPFALDGQVRNDLLITAPVSVSATNWGFWLGGAIDPNGVSRKPFVERQLILIRSDRAGLLEEPTAEPYRRAVLKDVGEAVMDKKNADAPDPPRRHRGIAGRARAGGGVMTNHPASSSGYEEAARAGAAPPPTGHRHGPPTSNREAATQAAWWDTALLSIGQLRTEIAALQIRVNELTLALAPINADNNQLRRELAAIRIERNTFHAEAMTA